MSFNLAIQCPPQPPLQLTVNLGEMLFILGANGTGKSSLMQAFTGAHSNNARRITAHRQTWMRSGSPEFTANQRLDYENNLKHFDRQENARWMDDFAPQRAQMAIFDLVNAENVWARNIAQAAAEENIERVKALSKEDSPIKVINRLLRLANLEISISIGKNDEITATKAGSTPYSIARLSDGERNAILIASNVLTVEPGTLLLIDEPERHLHRSIVSPLLTLLLQERKDCAFVVSTHEPMLSVDSPQSKVLLTRSCIYTGNSATSYDVDLLVENAKIDDDLKRTILGERRKIVFVEGVEHSLDKPLYSLIFPNASIVAKSSCRDVENAVIGIKNASELHWVMPFGLVDNDAAEASEIAELRSNGIYPLMVYAVESVYYHPDVQKLVGIKHAEVIGGNIVEILQKAKNAAIVGIRQNGKHLSQRVAERTARAKVFTLLPKKGEVERGEKRQVEIDFAAIAKTEDQRLSSLLHASDFIGLLGRYPVRESPALDAIARELGFTGRGQYEQAVRKLLIDDPKAVEAVRTLLGALPPELGAA